MRTPTPTPTPTGTLKGGTETICIPYCRPSGGGPPELLKGALDSIIPGVHNCIYTIHGMDDIWVEIHDSHPNDPKMFLPNVFNFTIIEFSTYMYGQLSNIKQVP